MTFFMDVFSIVLDLNLIVLILWMNGSQIKSVKRVWESSESMVSEIVTQLTLFV